MEQPPEGTPEKLSEYLTRQFNGLILSVNSLKDTVRLWNKNGFTGTFIGNLTGNVTGNIAGDHFSFPAIQASSSNVNTLDDYDENTWTPTLSGFTFVGTNTSTYAYTKIGRLVVINILVSGVTSVSIASGATITLPFTQTSYASGAFVNATGAQSVPAVINSNVIRAISAGPAEANYFFSASYFAAT
jgi:hypothetical protein